MAKNHVRLVLVCLVTVLLSSIVAACGTPKPQPGGLENVQDIHVQPAEASRSNAGTEEFGLPNCGGTSELSQSLGTQTSVKRAVTLGAKASATVGGEVDIPAAAKAKLEAAVELAYQQTYETASSRLDTIAMKAAPMSHVVYVIQWEEQRFESNVTFSANGKTYETPYAYTLGTPKISDSYQVACPASPTPPQPTADATATALAFSPAPITSNETTLRGLDRIDLETGLVSAAPAADRPWDLLFGCWPESRESLRALDGVSWFEKGVANFDAIPYRDLRDANYAAPTNPETGYPDLYFAHMSNVPGKGYTFYIKTPEGNVAKLQITGYELVDNNPAVCRNMSIRYEVFPVVSGP
jgi:hypothetical protein